MIQDLENTQNQFRTEMRSTQVNEIDFASAYEALITSYLQLVSKTQKRFLPLEKDKSYEDETLSSKPVETCNTH